MAADWRRVKWGWVLLASGALLACGSGSSSVSNHASGGGSSSSGGTTKVSVNLANAIASSLANGISAPTLAITGTYNNLSVTGTGAYTRAPASAVTFDSTAAAQQAVTLTTGTITESGGGTVAVPAALGYLYFNAAGALIGSTTVDATNTVTEYDVATIPTAFPTTITVGENGSLSTFNRFTDATQNTFLGSDTYAYSVLANGSSTSSVIFEVQEQIADSGSTNPTIVTTDYVVTNSGTMGLQSIRVTILGTQDLTYTAP